MPTQCEHDGCRTRSSFDIPGGKGRFCAKHKMAEMVDVKNKRCEHDGCSSLSTAFDIPGGKGRFCVKHKTAIMMNVKSKQCEHDGCSSLNPNFNIPGGNGKGRFCGKHKTAEMVDVKNKRCEHDGCDSQPNFNIPGGKGRFCVSHKTAEMVDVKNRRCEHDGCDSQPAFDIPGGKGRFCGKHKTDDMVDVKHKRCKYDGCCSRPTFDIPGGKGRFCGKHKTAEMVDVRSKRCEHDGCDSHPAFDIPGGKGSGRFCGKHKTSEMVDVKSKRCEHDGCSTLNPNFDILGGNGRFCGKHKTTEMVDVKTKKCEHDGCYTSASYGKPGHPKSHCSPHRQKGMIRRPNAKCVSCKELAIWGQNWIPTHCESHKTDDDQNLVEQPCISCTLMYVLDKEGKCENCNPASFATARLAKQNALMDYLDARDLKGDSTDVIVDGGICGKERPDRIYDFGDKIVILECDENQHQDRQCLCEQTRMVNIGQIFGGIPVYFIRWNPDDYSPESDRKNPEELAKRHKLVGDLIRDIKKGKHILPTALVSAIYMYYDGWSSLAESEWTVLTEFATNTIVFDDGTAAGGAGV